MVRRRELEECSTKLVNGEEELRRDWLKKESLISALNWLNGSVKHLKKKL